MSDNGEFGFNPDQLKAELKPIVPGAPAGFSGSEQAYLRHYGIHFAEEVPKLTIEGPFPELTSLGTFDQLRRGSDAIVPPLQRPHQHKTDVHIVGSLAGVLTSVSEGSVVWNRGPRRRVE